MSTLEIQLEIFDGYDTPTEDLQVVKNKYYFWIDGYSLRENIAFIIFEMGIGSNEIEAVYNAYDKVSNRLLIRYHIQVSELKIKESKLLPQTEEPKQRTEHFFYPLESDLIIEFKEDEEKYFMSLEDK